MNKSWIVTLETDESGELILPLSDEMLDGTGIGVGDTVEWIDNKDGSWTLKKKEEEEKVWVMVEALQTFRMRYMVEVPATNPEWALDTVTCNEAKEFSQLALPEVISSHRVMTQEEALALCDEDNDYTKSWNDAQKMKAFFTKDGEKVNL
jgi:hypothetical protein